MNGFSHRKVTERAFGLWHESTLYTLQRAVIWDRKDTVVDEAKKTDDYRDLEFVDVWGGKDDPHRDSAWDNDDEPHTSYEGHVFTRFNHYIDIKKGPGRFDDYDGYSYNLGSARKDQFQDASAVTTGFVSFVATLSGDKVDEGLNWWFNDEYVHAPGQPWYRGCSPALERYSFPEDKGVYAGTTAELKARFPLAENTGQRGKGIPYSVFMPVDNMARYWYTRYGNTREAVALGPVMHAIQDASIPHHAAGYNGNWHMEYERDLDRQIEGWLRDPGFAREAKELFAAWNKRDSAPPASLDRDDWRRTPAANWRIDRLVTWLALNAYREYDQTYQHFRRGYRFNQASAKKLCILAAAMSMLVLEMASGPAIAEHCIRIDPQGVRHKYEDRQHYVYDKDRPICKACETSGEAEQVVQIVKHYGMNSKCFVGSPNDPSMEYFLVDGKAPMGALPDEECFDFNPRSIKLKRRSLGWYIVQGGQNIVHIGDKTEDAKLALRIIRNYGFNHVCHVGHPRSMTYFRR
jgi:hypothetical protein